MSFARTKAFALPLLATLVLAGTAVANADPISNGNFNAGLSSGGYQYDPTGTGWNFSGGAGIQASPSAWGFSTPPGGSGQSAFLQSYVGSISVPTGNPTSSISQTAAGLTGGDSYGVTFYLEQRPGYGSNPVTVTIDGVSVTIDASGDNTWTKYTEYFTAGGTDTLTFSVTGTGVGPYDNDTGLADVSIGAAPEPGTLLLLGSGLLGFAGMARRKLGKKSA